MNSAWNYAQALKQRMDRDIDFLRHGGPTRRKKKPFGEVMGHFVDVSDIGIDYLLLMACEHRLSSGDAASCLHQIERLARESPYEGVRASANELLRQHRERHDGRVQ